MKARLIDLDEVGMEVIVTLGIASCDFNLLPEGDLDVSIKKWRSPRSREALNYSWQIITEMAEKLSQENPISKDEVYKRLVNDYGVLERDEENQLIKLVIKDEIDPMRLDIYLHKTPHSTMIEGTKYRLYYVVKPPHEYNTKEFAQFLDQIIREARELGIEVDYSK